MKDRNQQTTELTSLVKWQQARCEQLQHELECQFGASSAVMVLPSGSLVSGHHIGIKNREHSFNPHCPFDSFFEIDIRIILEPKSHTIHDGESLDKLRTAIKPDYESEPLFGIRFSRTVPIMYLMCYETTVLGPVEWEITVNQAPFMELAPFYHRLFSQQEIAVQRDIRLKTLYEGNDIYDAYGRIKQIQVLECIWRMVAAQALVQLDYDFAPKISKQTVLSGLVAHWMSGDWGIAEIDRAWKFQQPDNNVSAYEPTWVAHAFEIQHIIKQKAIKVKKSND